MEWELRRVQKWVKLITKVDINNQKVRDNTLPSFRPADTGDKDQNTHQAHAGYIWSTDNK